MSSNYKSDNSEENFEIELYESFRRYFSNPDLEFGINLTDTDGTVYKPHEAFNAVFDEWKVISSKWDRLGLLYSFWDETEFGKLDKWQVLERYNNDRLPLESVKFQENKLNGDDQRNPLVLVALAKTYRLLSHLSSARSIIEYTFNNSPKDSPFNQRISVEYANILHLHDDERDKERAHQLIQEILQKKIAASEDSEIALLNFFAFSTGYIDSSIFAAIFLTLGQSGIDDWDAMANEYYYCPVFRHEHAVKLAGTGQVVHALAKLKSLTEEFPWYKQGLVAMVNMIRKLRIQMNQPSFMEDELKKLDRRLSSQ